MTQAELERFFHWADPASVQRVLAVAGEAYHHWLEAVWDLDEAECLSDWTPSRHVCVPDMARAACQAASELEILAALWPETSELLGPVRLPRPRRRRIA
jgi:hypothetical protein